jgi:hypothetical protein
MTAQLPPWPKEADFAVELKWRDFAGNEIMEAPFIDRQSLERAMNEAYAARLRVAVEALNCLLPALHLDLRYASDDDDKDALRSRVNGVCEALNAIGELPQP